MARPGAASVPAGCPLPVPSYSAIVNILDGGGVVSLTIILRGYFYEKYQLEGDGVTRQNVKCPVPKRGAEDLRIKSITSVSVLEKNDALLCFGIVNSCIAIVSKPAH